MYQILLLICTFNLLSIYANNNSNTLVQIGLGKPHDGGILCEKHPTHLSCKANLNALGHLPLNTTHIEHCRIFVATQIHCCKEFCKAGGSGSSGGKCDEDTGACFCEPSGEPKNCAQLTIAPGAPGYEKYDKMVKEQCVPKCAKNKNGCTSVQSSTAGPIGTVCMCYCPST